MTMEELSIRLERMEQTNRRTRAGGLVILLLLVAVATVGQVAPEENVIRARVFEAVNDKGDVRASLGVSPEGVPVLIVGGGDDEAGVMIAVVGGHASVALKSVGNTGGTSIYTSADGTTCVSG